ncbi:MAG: fibronectin type III domain-containing protein [Armatimonadetes bacterium]|nr:fibronectin type III domain-containing protein [Armatimonadota bacterium]
MRAVWAIAAALCAAIAFAEIRASPPPPTQVELADDPEDGEGTVLLVRWRRPAAPAPQGWKLAGYRVWVAEEGKEFKPARLVTDPRELSTSLEQLDPRRRYVARVEAVYVREGQKLSAEPNDLAAIAKGVEFSVSSAVEAGPARPLGKLFDIKKLNILVSVALYAVIVLVTLKRAQRRQLYIRPIAGLQAVDDAIGRATEMGRPLLYVSGLGGVSSISTIASMLILGHLARRTASYETPILVPCIDPLVMTAEREIVREAYLEAGKPDAFRPDNIFFITDSQFGYVAAVDGIIMRERPAANFYMGAFFAESLILAETGNMAGSVQIAGTDADTQLPFFITACDYTLMGEELYAAGAYLSRHPILVAQLKGQDIGKVILAAVLAVGVLLASLNAFGIAARAHELFMRALGT